MSNEAKTKQLGMPYGTASGKLRKLLLFKFSQELGKDICFRCNQRIETTEEFSIDHKIPWLYSNTKLFWDLNNIAFSHISCNNKAGRRYINAPWKSAPIGETWCSGCKIFLPVDKFSKKTKGNKGYVSQCYKCVYKRRNKV